MATPGMSRQQHYGGGGRAASGPAQPDCGPELHLKMSKKIAQLTKKKDRVICPLPQETTCSGLLLEILVFV